MRTLVSCITLGIQHRNWWYYMASPFVCNIRHIFQDSDN